MVGYDGRASWDIVEPVLYSWTSGNIKITINSDSWHMTFIFYMTLESNAVIISRL